MMIKKSGYILPLLFMIGLAEAQQPKETMITKIITGQYGFESAADINGWSAKDGNLSISAAHYKDGQCSLQWDWKKGAMLQVLSLKGLKEAGEIYPGGIPEAYEPSFYPRARFGGIKIWLYQESRPAAK